MKMLYFIIALLFCSCGEYYTNVNSTVCNIDSLYLQYYDEVVIQLDSHTPIDWSNTYIVEYDDSVYVLVYNTYTSELNYFNLLSGLLSKQVKCELEHIDGIYLYDNVIYAHNYKNTTFFTMDFNGNILDTVKINSIHYDYKHYPPYLVSVFNGIYPLNEKQFYLTTYTVGEGCDNIRHCGMIFNKENKEFNYKMPYPEIYSKANWGGGMYRVGYSAYNKEKNYIIYSFPALHCINVYDIKLNSYKEFYAGSKNINEIVSYSDDIGSSVPDNESFKHYISNNNYGAIIYDKNRNLYYRVAEIANFHKEEKYKYLKRLSVIILNEQFDKIGETTFDKPYGTTLLISSDYIYIPYLDEVGYDTAMKYHKFKIQCYEK